MRDQLEEVAPLPVERVVSEVDKLREAMKALESLASLVPGNVAESFVAQAPVPLSDRELSRRLTLEAKLGLLRAFGWKKKGCRGWSGRWCWLRSMWKR